MSNETKRDVFENALDELLLSKDDGALDAELRCRYDAALPDDLQRTERRVGGSMTETKQDVFNAAVEKAIGMTLVAGYTAYGDKYREDMQKRYVAASDGDPACPYCHTPSGREATKQEYINDYMVYEATGDPVDTLDYGMLAGVICCQWCGRRLEAKE